MNNAIEFIFSILTIIIEPIVNKYINPKIEKRTKIYERKSEQRRIKRQIIALKNDIKKAKKNLKYNSNFDDIYNLFLHFEKLYKKAINNNHTLMFDMIDDMLFLANNLKETDLYKTDTKKKYLIDEQIDSFTSYKDDFDPV